MANSYQEYHWRFRDDSTALNTDGGWLAAEDTKPSARDTGTANRFRIRFVVGNDNSKTGTPAFALYVDKDGGGYNPVTGSSSNVQATGGLPADGDPCNTQLLSVGGVGSFETDGSYDEGDGVTPTWTHDKNNYCEIEFCVYIVDADVSGGETLTFRVYESGVGAFGTYPTPDASIDVAGAAGLGIPIVMQHRKQMAGN